MNNTTTKPTALDYLAQEVARLAATNAVLQEAYQQQADKITELEQQLEELTAPTGGKS